MKPRILTLLSLAAMAPLAAPRGLTRNTPFGRRGPSNHRPLLNDPGAGGDGNGTKGPTTGAKDPPADPPADPPRSFSQAELDRIVSREKGKTAKELEAAQKRLQELEAAQGDLAEKAKAGDEAGRFKRDLEKTTKERDDLAKTAADRLTRYHGKLVGSAVSSALLGLEFVGADAAEVVESRLRSMAKVEEAGKGEDDDKVYLVDGKLEIDASDKAAVAAWIRKRFPSLVKAASGSGGPHGGGKGGGAADDLKGLTPGQLISRDLKA